MNDNQNTVNELNKFNQQSPSNSNQIPNNMNQNNNSFPGFNPFDQYKPQSRPISPNFSKEELANVEVPLQIGKEIRLEKLRIVIIFAIGFIAAFVSSFFIALDATATPEGNFLKLDPAYVPHVAGMSILLIVAAMFMLIALINFKHLTIDIKRFKSDILLGRENVPFFIIKNYKNLLKRTIYVSWISFSMYIFGGAAIGIMYGVNQIESVYIDTEIIIVISIVAVTFFIHLVSLIANKIRKGNIDAYYGYEIVSIEQQAIVKKGANKVCMILFFGILGIIFFFIFIPYVIIRRKNGKKIFPFI